MFRNAYKINITDHAADRLRQRLGLKGRSAEKKAFVAFREGIDLANARGQLADYINELNDRYESAAYVKIYNECAYVFSRENGKGRTYRTDSREIVVNLITVYPVPGEISKAYNAQKKRNHERVNYIRTTEDALAVAGLA